MRNLHIDLSQPSHPLDRFFQHCIGAGRAHEMLRAEALDQLTMLQNECGFRYLRFHGLLSDDMAVYTERDGKPWYNWQYIDLVFDAILIQNTKHRADLEYFPHFDTRTVILHSASFFSADNQINSNSMYCSSFTSAEYTSKYLYKMNLAHRRDSVENPSVTAAQSAVYIECKRLLRLKICFFQSSEKTYAYSFLRCADKLLAKLYVLTPRNLKGASRLLQ